MSSRTFDRAAALALLLLAGCGGGAEPGGPTIACGPAAAEPAERCGIEVTDRGGDLRLTLRRPDGGFRRLVWPRGRALAAADGAEVLAVTRLPGGGVDAVIAGWRYRLDRIGTAR